MWEIVKGASGVPLLLVFHDRLDNIFLQWVRAKAAKVRTLHFLDA